jgi:hypothetical protein
LSLARAALLLLGKLFRFIIMCYEILLRGLYTFFLFLILQRRVEQAGYLNSIHESTSYFIRRYS